MKSSLKLLLTLASLSLISSPSLFAEEGGSGHYLPGSMASFVDGVPAATAFAARVNLIAYDASHALPLPIAGLQPASVDLSLFAAGLSIAWRPEWGQITPKWSYAMSATLAHVSVELTGNLTLPVPVPGTTVRRTTTVSGLGDVVLMPVMLNYTVSPDLHVDFRTALILPTGSYELGRLANTGKNYFTFEPTVGLVYFGLKNGREASVFMGMDFNGENEDTHYKSGNQFRIEGTLAQHFPLAGGLVGVGVTGFWYDQITDDSGTGATLGAFKGHTMGYGPVLSYVVKAGKADVVTELKWLKETGTKNRLQGDYLWAKIILKF